MKEILTKRIGAIDAMRAITMFLMLFVNDMAGIPGVAHWLKHAEMTEDMLGFSDLVFPAFLFCVGLSVPYAIQARYRKGDDALQVIGHVVERTVALVVMGLFTLGFTPVEGGISRQCYLLLMVLGFVLIWNVYPKSEGWKNTLWRVLRWAGMALLLYLAVSRDIAGNPLKVSWWGILGLIGWTYMVSAGAYIFTRGRLLPLAITLAVVMVLSVIVHSQIVPDDWGLRFLLLPFMPSDWTLHALGLTGVITSVLMQRAAERGVSPSVQISWMLGVAVVLLVAGFVAHNYWIISKIQATPTWYCFCMAIFLPMLGFLYWLTDVKGKRNAFRLIRAAGTATLTCYIVPYAWYAVQPLLGASSPAMFNYGGWGLVRSAVFALVIVLLVEALGKLHVKLKI